MFLIDHMELSTFVQARELQLTVNKVTKHRTRAKKSLSMVFIEKLVLVFVFKVILTLLAFFFLFSKKSRVVPI